MFQLHSGRVNVAVMFISYRLEVLYPPPSLRDTSAGGGYGMTFFAIATQSRIPGIFYEVVMRRSAAVPTRAWHNQGRFFLL